MAKAKNRFSSSLAIGNPVIDAARQGSDTMEKNALRACMI
jgi:hypothetical protein